MPGKIHVPISVNIEGVQKVASALGKMRNSFAAATGALAALTARTTVNFAAGAIEGARDLERNIAGLETVFGTATSQMMDFSKNAAAMGLSLSEAAKASTFIGSVLKQSGFSIEQTADLTEDLVTLGADLALTYGYDVQEALLGMTALFRGEYDPIEKFGVAMKQSEIDAEKLARGMGHLTGAAERFADQQIRVEFLMERAADAMGQVERQQNSLAVQQNRLNATFNTMRDIVGMELTPVIAELTGAVADMLTRIMPKVQETFAGFEEPIRRLAFWLLPAIEGMLNEFLNFLQDVAEIINLATDPTSELGNALQEARLAIDELFAGFENFGLEVPSFVDIVSQSIINLANFIRDTAIAIDEVLTFVGAFITALGRFDIWKILWGDEAERRRFSEFISSAQFMRRNMRDATMEQKNATEDLIFTEELLSRVQKQQADRYLDFLNKRAAEVADVIKEEERLARLDTKITDGIAKDLKEANVKDPVGDFFAKLEDEINKQAARLQLESFGLSDALIQQILGSADWEQIFDTIINGGIEAAQKLQNAFNQTSAGIQEAKEAAEEYQQALQDLADLQAERQEAIDNYNKEVKDATDAFMEFVEATQSVISGIDPLLTYERAIGKFESATRRDLEQIENQLEAAFDNGYLLEESKNNLLAYARTELSILMGIQRQRDELLAERNAAADVIFGIAQAVAASGNITGLLRDVEDKVTEINVSEVFEGLVETAGSLEGFKVTLTRNFIDVVTETVSASQALTSNFQAVIDRTRAFIDNLVILREMGLDPFLFNQLVEAGAEAGGATAQALVDGGADTIAEVNRLQGELEAMGVELGEMTYEVTKNSGEQFVSGIIDGMDSELERLQERALAFAQDFSRGFAAAVNASMQQAFAAILDQISAEFAKILAEIDRKIAEMEEKLRRLESGTRSSAGTGITTVIIDPITREPVNVGDVEIPQEEKDWLIATGMVPADFFGSSGMMSTNATVTNNYDLTVNANGSSGSTIATEVVNALKTWNSTNGDYQISLTGFGN